MPKTALAKVIGERLRAMRKRQGLSQEELAHRSNTHPTYIGQIERGEKNITIDTLEKITKALNVSLEEVFRFSSLNNNNNNNNIDEKVIQLNNLLLNVSEEDRESLIKIINVLLDWRVRTDNKLSS